MMKQKASKSDQPVTWPTEDGELVDPATLSPALWREPDMFAVSLRGDSMCPVYRNGDVLIGSRRSGADLSRVVGSDCIIKTAAGAGYAKTVLRGSKPGLFRLRSYNPAYQDLEDVALEWAAPIRYIICGSERVRRRSLTEGRQ